MIIEYKHTIVDITDDKWLMFYDDETNKLLTNPFQSSGSYTCANTLVVADTKQECDDYISQHKLVNPFEDSGSSVDLEDYK